MYKLHDTFEIVINTQYRGLDGALREAESKALDLLGIRTTVPDSRQFMAHNVQKWDPACCWYEITFVSCVSYRDKDEQLYVYTFSCLIDCNDDVPLDDIKEINEPEVRDKTPEESERIGCPPKWYPTATAEQRSNLDKFEGSGSNPPEFSGSKYLKKIATNPEGYSDVYNVITAFGITCPAQAHALKKLLMAGKRGKGDILQDLSECRDAITRAMELNCG